MNSKRQRAFSLIEVVIAIGIMAFAMTAMLSLLAVAMRSDKQSGSDTALSEMSRQVFNNLRALPYSTLPAATNYYFDLDGAPCAQTNANYTCVVTVTNDSAVASGNLTQIQMQFTWPYSAVNRPYTNIFYGSIANYGY